MKDMSTHHRSRFTIGSLAKRTGVPVKTIRFYSDEGILPPTEVTVAGYRRYSEDDLVRLETIRTLRSAGFDIATIRAMLNQEMDPQEATRIQVDALNVQERTLRRQRLMLERALRTGDVIGQPERARALALLSSAERSSFLRNRLETGIEGVPVDGGWWNSFLDAAVEGIPEELSDEQLAAWIELAGMTNDPSFAEAVRKTATPFWEGVAGSGTFSTDAWQRDQQAFIEKARQARNAGVTVDSPEARAIVGIWIEHSARVMGRENNEDFARWFLKHAIETHDPRLSRYWQLVAVIRNWPRDTELQADWDWIISAVRFLDP